jgi:hypothetical protein
MPRKSNLIKKWANYRKDNFQKRTDNSQEVCDKYIVSLMIRKPPGDITSLVLAWPLSKR